MDVDQASNIKAKRNLAAFERRYRRWVAPVYRYFRYRVNNDKEAEDLTSQVFLKVYEQLPTYTEQGQFPAWLFTIVRHQAADHFRSGQPVVPLDEIDLKDDQPNILEQATHSDDLQRLSQLIRSLPDSEQELIRLRFVAQLTYKDIAALLGSTRDAIRKQVSRLLARLQDEMEKDHA
jgi:RNA polymerase sigma-70 factor (ECF subfamily)